MGIKVTDTIDDLNHTCTTYVCKNCSTHLLSSSWIIPGEFTGSHGKAYFVSKLMNYVVPREFELRHLMTGYFRIKDVRCKQCFTTVGWKYYNASSPSQKYKENHFVIEANLIRKLKTGDSLMSYLTDKSSGGLQLKNQSISSERLREFAMSLNKNTYRITNNSIDTWKNVDKYFDLAKNGFVSVDIPDKLVYKDNTRYFEMKKDLLANSKHSGRFRYYFSNELDGHDPGSFFTYKENRGYMLNDDDDHYVTSEEADDNEDKEVEQEDEEEEEEEEEIEEEEELEEDGGEEESDVLFYHRHNYSEEEENNEDETMDYHRSPRRVNFGNVRYDTSSYHSGNSRYDDPQSYYLLHPNTRGYFPRFRSLLRVSNAIFNNSPEQMSLDHLSSDLSNSAIPAGVPTEPNSESAVSGAATAGASTATTTGSTATTPGATGSNMPSNFDSIN